MASQGIPQPKFAIVESLAAALEESRGIGYPLIAKPFDGTGSRFVKKLHSENELETYFDQITHLRTPVSGIFNQRKVILEEYLEGSLFSAETISQAGQHHILGFTSRILSKEGNFVELGGSFPASPTPSQKDEMQCFVKRCLTSIGVQFGPTHTELILTKEGPRIVEINPRFAGGPVADIVSATTGTDIPLLITRLHLGEKTKIPMATKGFGSILAICASIDGKIEEITLANRIFEGILRYQIYAKPDQTVRPPQSNEDRLGFVVTFASSLENAESLATEIIEQTKIKFAPL